MADLLLPDHPERKGVLIAFEGIDGCGKSAMARMLGEWLRERDVKILYTFEPTDLTYGRKLRESFVARERLIPRRELELFRKDRMEHVEQYLRPALAEGRVILLDRYYYSSMAYQGSRGYKSPEEIHNMMTAFSPKPDLTLLFTVTLATAQKRITHLRKDDPNLLERMDNLTRVKQVFDEMDLPEIVRVPAGGSKKQVFARVLEASLPVLGKVADPDTLTA